MDLLVKEIMQRNVRTIAPWVTLPELEQALLKERVSGFPFVDKGELVGIVSRSDIVRQLFLEHHAAESTSDFYFDDSGFHETPLVTFEQIADRVGERIERLQVQDVMSRTLVKVSPDQPVRQVAQTLIDNHIHRVLVTEENRLLGLVSALDLISLIASGRVKVHD
jgi:CBS domain-containing protein